MKILRYLLPKLAVIATVVVAPVATIVAAPVMIALAVVTSLFSVFVAVCPIPKVPLSYNLRNLQVHWLTAFVTSLAIVLVVALMTCMLAFVKGMDKLTEGSGRPDNILILADGATDEAFSRLPPNGIQELPQDVQNEVGRIGKDEFLFSREVYVIVTQTSKSVKGPDEQKPGVPIMPFVLGLAALGGGIAIGRVVFDDELRPALRTVGRSLFGVGLGGLCFAIFFPWEVVVRPPDDAEPREQTKRRFCQMRGIENPKIAAAIHDIQLTDVNGKPSRWFSSTGEKEVVLGNGVAKAYGRDVGKETLEPGDEVQLGEWTWKVVGVMSPASSTFGSEVWVHDGIVQSNFGRPNSYSSFVIQVKDPSRTKLAAEAIKNMGTIAFTVAPEREYYAKMSATNDMFRGVFYFIAVVMAIGGVLGVMITMFAAVSQRARDIGVLRLLGYARWQILCSFMLETLGIGVLGGILGVGIGSLCHGYTVSSIVSAGPGGGGKGVVLQLVVDGELMLGGMIFALVMSAVGGFVPAVFAMRLRPLESLR